MQQTFETEVLGVLQKNEFEELKSKVEGKLGKPRTVKRLSMQATDYSRRDLDTRIRITNGQAEIMQKIGDWDAKTRQELGIALPLVPEVIHRHWQVLNNILNSSNVQKNIIQMDSYIFKTDEYEIKFTRQYGGEDAYNFEIESFRSEIDPVHICQE